MKAGDDDPDAPPTFQEKIVICFSFSIFCTFFINWFFLSNILYGTTLSILALCLWEHLSQLMSPISEPPTMQLPWMTVRCNSKCYRLYRIRKTLQLTQVYVLIPEQHTEGKIPAFLCTDISCAPLGIKGWNTLFPLFKRTYNHWHLKFIGVLFFHLVLGFLPDGFTFRVPRTANSLSRSSKWQTLTYISFTKKACITVTEYHSPQDVSRNQTTMVCLFLFVKQRQKGKC